MKHVSVVVLGVSICLSGCMISPQKRGTVSIEGIGTKVLTEKGDQLMQSGVYAKREVSADFAEGYEKGLSDAVKREYWSMQDAQRFAR